MLNESPCSRTNRSVVRRKFMNRLGSEQKIASMIVVSVDPPSQLDDESRDIRRCVIVRRRTLFAAVQRRDGVSSWHVSVVSRACTCSAICRFCLDRRDDRRDDRATLTRLRRSSLSRRVTTRGYRRHRRWRVRRSHNRSRHDRTFRRRRMAHWAHMDHMPRSRPALHRTSLRSNRSSVGHGQRVDQSKQRVDAGQINSTRQKCRLDSRIFSANCMART